jgi:hypothetical protein
MSAGLTASGDFVNPLINAFENSSWNPHLRSRVAKAEVIYNQALDSKGRKEYEAAARQFQDIIDALTGGWPTASPLSLSRYMLLAVWG